MLPDRRYTSGWRGALLVAIAYIDFLIFAQFAFLTRLNQLGVATGHLRAVMATMAAGGILFSLLNPRLNTWPFACLRMQIGLVLSAVAAFLTLLPLDFPAAIAVAFLVGAGLGILTVTLATHLREWSGKRNPLLAVGAGTGVGYLVCNLPPLFTASAQTQAIVAGVLCIAGLFIPLTPVPAHEEQLRKYVRGEVSFIPILAAFTALVWLDSAAFFIIQNNGALKAGTWHGSTHLWLNGLLHCAAAIASGLLLRRRGVFTVLATAFIALGAACLLLLSPGNIFLASLLYPVGVSLYSVALVAYPSLLTLGSIYERPRFAGWLYAVAGWIGSAMGIGMVQNLSKVPPVFVAAAGAVILAPQLISSLRKRKREISSVATIALVSVFMNMADRPVNASHQISTEERGRQVYISEGCIHCHSQYVRPDSPDILMWGPVEPVEQIRLKQPPLIGNRRQGPDLTQVGARRSALWLKAHLYAPAEVSGASIMPSYASLFHDERGDDLVAYLTSLHSSGAEKRAVQEEAWRPSNVARTQANAGEGQQLYNRYCATCHDSTGNTRRAWRTSFHHPPNDISTGPYRTLEATASSQPRSLQIARIAKFGIPETDMPGHEYLSDRQISSIGVWLSQRIAQSNSQP